MKTLQEKAKADNEVMKTLKLSEINHIIAQTTRGTITLRLPFEGTSDDYRFYLDSVKQDDETNARLLKAFNGISYII